jgi:hypothetical protein
LANIRLDARAPTLDLCARARLQTATHRKLRARIRAPI